MKLVGIFTMDCITKGLLRLVVSCANSNDNDDDVG
jgi:hypothetical protein